MKYGYVRRFGTWGACDRVVGCEWGISLFSPIVCNRASVNNNYCVYRNTFYYVVRSA